MATTPVVLSAPKPVQDLIRTCTLDTTHSDTHHTHSDTHSDTHYMHNDTQAHTHSAVIHITHSVTHIITVTHIISDTPYRYSDIQLHTQ